MIGVSDPFTLPARDGIGQRSVEEGWCPGEAPAAAAIRDPEQGWEWPGVLRLHRPSRTQGVPLSPLSGANPRDGPTAARLHLGDWRDRRNPAGSHTRMAPESGVTPRPFRARRQRSLARIDASARSPTRLRWPIDFLYPTGSFVLASPSPKKHRDRPLSREHHYRQQFQTVVHTRSRHSDGVHGHVPRPLPSCSDPGNVQEL